MRVFLGFAGALVLSAAVPVSFERDVQPILVERCQGCHHTRAALPLMTAAAVAKSSVLQMISGERPRMPKSGAPLDAQQVATIRQWIAEGAKDDSKGWWIDCWPRLNTWPYRKWLIGASNENRPDTRACWIAMSTFTSVTAHCARCHDHKVGPIPQQEYYVLHSVFAGIDRANRPYDLDPAAYQQSQASLRQ